MHDFSFENQEVRLLRLLVKACLLRLVREAGTGDESKHLTLINQALRERILHTDSPFEQAMLILVFDGLRIVLSKTVLEKGQEGMLGFIAEAVDQLADKAKCIRV